MEETKLEDTCDVIKIDIKKLNWESVSWILLALNGV
jgi:hypothetical protein